MRSSFEIARSPADVYAYVTDPARFPEWQSDVVRVQVEDGGRRFATTRRIGRVEHTTMQEVTQASPPHSWAVRGVDGAFRPHASVTVEPLAGGTRSRVTIDLDFEGRGIGRLLPIDAISRIAARGAPRSYQNLKERLEGTA